MTNDAAPRRIILDTDPGIDDAMAIAVALASPELELLALTTVFGNHEVGVTTANAQRILDALGHPDVPVVRGAHVPLVRPRHPPATFVHGDDGLGDAGYPPPSTPPVAGRNAAQHIVDTVLGDPGQVTIVTLGPMTNLALALRLEPGIVDAVGGVVAMAGAALVPGNVTPAAEANVWNDPDAAEIVLGAGWPLTLIGLDVTHKVTADRAWLDDVGCVETAAAHLVAAIAPAYLRFHQATDGLDGIHCHDVAAVVDVFRPDFFTTRSMAVRVVTDGVAAGATLATDRTGLAGDGWDDRARVEVAVDVEADALLDLVRERLCRQPAHG